MYGIWLGRVGSIDLRLSDLLEQAQPEIISSAKIVT
jgi:hypothetical protein